MTAGRVSAYILLGLNGLEFANSIRAFFVRLSQMPRGSADSTGKPGAAFSVRLCRVNCLF